MNDFKVIIPVFLILMLIGCATTKGDWERAQKLNSINAYQEFLQKHPKSEFTAGAKRQILLLDWKRAKSVDTIEAYQDFLQKHTKSNFSAEAEERIKEVLEWKNTKADNSYEGYKKFLHLYPQSMFVEEAKQHLSFIREQEWAEATQSNTINAYTEYLQKHPYDQYFIIANQRINKIEEEEIVKSIELTATNNPPLKKAILNAYNAAMAIEKFAAKHISFFGRTAIGFSVAAYDNAGNVQVSMENSYLILVDPMYVQHKISWCETEKDNNFHSIVVLSRSIRKEGLKEASLVAPSFPFAQVQTKIKNDTLGLPPCLFKE